jgi:hypothetical protein
VARRCVLNKSAALSGISQAVTWSDGATMPTSSAS